MFVDLLKPCAVFSKVMQRDEVDILCAMTSIVKTVKEVKKLGDLPLESWPTYSATIKKITCENGDYIYQCQTLKAYDQGKALLAANYRKYCSSVTECLKSRLKWSNIDLIRDIIIILEAQGWQKIVEERESRSETLDPLQAAVERVASKFAIPLEAAGVYVDKLYNECNDMLDYATPYLP